MCSNKQKPPIQSKLYSKPVTKQQETLRFTIKRSNICLKLKKVRLDIVDWPNIWFINIKAS
jgi:hypothetical protein